MKRSGILLLGSLALLSARPAEAVCKMVINVDRTASMTAASASGASRCSVAQNSVLLMLEAYWRGLDFNLTNPGLGFTTRVEIDTDCPRPRLHGHGEHAARAGARVPG
ncbi:hypothetical protein ACLESO_33650 [Pyxidicoccus sp. 3LG]